MGSMGSVQFRIVPCSSLYFFSRSRGLFQCIQCSLQGFKLLHLSLPKQSPPFILASSVCKSLQCLISILTQGGKGDHLFRLICSVVLWGGRSTANKYHWRVWGVVAVYGPHWVCPSSQQCELSGSTLLGVQVALQGNCPKRALYFVHFPGSGSQVLHKGRLGWACVLCPPQVRTAQATRCLATALSQVES